MAIKFTYGTVGSGKSYEMMLGSLEDWNSGHFIATINLNLRLSNCMNTLKNVYGMSHWDASQCVSERGTEAIFIESRFREIRAPEIRIEDLQEDGQRLKRFVATAGPESGRRVKLKADECHFWWPRSSYYKLSIEDVLAAAMSRKRGMDMHLISQLNGQINQDIAGLSSDNWLARPMKQEPFYSGLKIYSRFARATGGVGRPAAFFYTRVEDELGKTRGRKDGTMDPDNKRLVFLHPLIARCYDTLEEVSSPVLDRVRDEAEYQYLIDILKGKVKPQATCPVCGGKRRAKLTRLFEYVDGDPRISTKIYKEGDELHAWFIDAVTDDCGECNSKGYIYPADHPDYARALAITDQLDTMKRRTNKAASA